MAAFGSLYPAAPWVDQPADSDEAALAQAAAEAAAARVRRSAKPEGGRQEGKTTAVLDSLGTSVYNTAAKMPRIWGALNEMVPGQSMMDRPDIVDAVAQTSTDLIGLPALTPGGIVKDAAGIFGGRLAKTADQTKLARAEELEGLGHKPTDIYDITGWFKGADGKWRFEIPDQAAKFNRVHGKSTIDNWPIDQPGHTSVGEAFNHPDLMAAYPDLKNLPLKFEEAKPFGSLGSYSPADPLLQALDAPEGITLATRPDRYGENLKGTRSVTLHELQHAVQSREGFARGGNPANFTQQYEAALARDALSFRREMDKLPKGMDRHAKENAIIKQYQDLGAMDWLPSREARDLAHDIHNNPNAQLSELVKLYGLDQKTTPYSARELYRRQAGEVEARNVEHRADWDTQKRADVPPAFSQDVPNSDQIVRFGSLSPQMSENLPMDKANREARAVMQGFVPPVHGHPAPLYHETTAANAAGIESGGFDISKIGARAGDEQMPNGVFLKRNGKSIGLTRPDDAEVQIPLLAKISTKVKEFPDREALSRHLYRDEKYAGIADEQKLLDREYNQRFADLEKRAWTRDESPDSISARKEMDVLLDEWKAKGNDIAGRARERGTELLKAQGLDGIRVWNDAGSFGRKVDTTVMFDPANLRSPYAKFDPVNEGKNMLLGSNAADRKTGATVIGADVARQPFGSMNPDRGE